MKTLVGAVTNILNKKVTEEQAKEFALNQYGVLVAYIRSEQVKQLLELKRQNKKVVGKLPKKK